MRTGTSWDLVRKYELGYQPITNVNTRSLLHTITLHGNDGSPFPTATSFSYNTPLPGFDSTPLTPNWSNPTVWDEQSGEIIYSYGDFIRDTRNEVGTISDLIDMNGDGLLERIVYDITDPRNGPWEVYTNNLGGFDSTPLPPWSNPSSAIWSRYNNIRACNPNQFDLVDMNGDKLPDRVVFKRPCLPPYASNCPWTVYFNNGVGFTDVTVPNWPNPSAWDDVNGNYIRNRALGVWDGQRHHGGYYTDVIDLNGDGLPDRVVYTQPTDYLNGDRNWKVYFNNANVANGFNPASDWYNPSSWNSADGNYLRNIDEFGTYADLIDMNGDGLPDRVVYSRDCGSPFNNCPWTVYFNNGSGFEDGVNWPNPSPYNAIGGNYIQNTSQDGAYTDLIDMNGDGLPDRVVYDHSILNTEKWTVYFNSGSEFKSPGVEWDYRSVNFIRRTMAEDDPGVTGIQADVFDIDGDGLPDRVVRDGDCAYPPNCTWTVYPNRGPVTDLLYHVDNGIGGSIQIEYGPSTDHYQYKVDGQNWSLPFVAQVVNSYTQTDGREGSYLYTYEYSGGKYNAQAVEFRGFQKVTAYQKDPDDPGNYESKTETTYLQGDYNKGKISYQKITSKEGHKREVANNWYDLDLGNGRKFPRLDDTTSTITDCKLQTDCQGANAYSYQHKTVYGPNGYDSYFNLIREEKQHLEGSQFVTDIITEFVYKYCTDQWILSKPTDIQVKNGAGQTFSRKWMEYNCTTGNMVRERVWKSDAPCSGADCATETPNDPIIDYAYTSDGTSNLRTITDPMNHVTSLDYDSTRTHVLTTTNHLGHITRIEYDPGTGNLQKLVPPHLQGSPYWHQIKYDSFGRKSIERLKDNTDPEIPPLTDRGSTSYSYSNFGTIGSQYIQKIEHIVVEGQPSRTLDHYTSSYFDGMGRTFWVSSSGPDAKTVVTETEFDSMGRVWKKSIPYLSGDYAPWTAPRTTTTYDGLSRVTNVNVPDYPQYRNIGTTYRGLTKIVTNQRNISTAYTYDVYQRLKKVEEDYNKDTGTSYSTTQYSYDTLGNLTQVIAALGATEQNTTSMTYDSLSKKITMTDPDMGTWRYTYYKSGNLWTQTDAKNQAIIFDYDEINRLKHKTYPDSAVVTYMYDETSVTNCAGQNISVPYPIGKLTRVYYTPVGGQDASEDTTLAFDLMQRATSSQKKIGAECVTFGKAYDSGGRTISITYPGSRVYSYQYDVAGNLLYLKDDGTQSHLVDYSTFTALGQPRIATFPGSVTSNYTYFSETGRLRQINTTGLTGTSPGDIMHDYTYDNLNRLETAKGNGGSLYDHSGTNRYIYDRIGNITFKPGVGAYLYDNYVSKPHQVRSAGNITFAYDLNGNMWQKVENGQRTTTIQWNYDNKAISITRTGGATVSYTYDGNGQRVKKVSGGSTVLYFGDGYEKRNGVGIIHLFAGNRRIASVDTNNPGYTQIYHPDHLGSSWFVTSTAGVIKEQNEFYPYGTYIEANKYDTSFPEVNYTFTGQEEDDEVGLYNYNARLYDPVLGKFISPDSLVPKPDDPQTLNRYSYVGNNPLTYTDPSGHILGIDDALFWFLLAGSVLFGGLSGAANAQINGGNWLKGALIGAVTGGAAFVGGLGITNLLFPSVLSATVSVSAGTKIAAAATGGFTAGAIGGAGNAAAAGGNIWQGALYGGLIGAAIAGTIQGAIELNNWVNSSQSVVTNSKMKDPITGKVVDLDEPWTAQAAEKILGAPPGLKGSDYAEWQKTGMPPMHSAGYGAEARQEFFELKDLCGLTGHCSTTFDWHVGSQNALKFNNYTLHIEYFSKIQYLQYHYDIFNLRTDFLSHLWVDVFKYQLYEWGVLLK